MSYISRSHPEDRDEPQAEAAKAKPLPMPRTEVPEPPLVEDCERCNDLHDPGVKCAAWLHDEASELLAELRRRGAVVTLKAEDIINVRGYEPDPEMGQAIKVMKPVLVAILRREAQA